MANIIFETIHGSHLYGLANPLSDLDWYVVHDGKGIKHTINEDTGVDMFSIGLDEFLAQTYRGVPQACEALFSPKKIVWQPQYMPMLDGIRVWGGEVTHRFERTIDAFGHGGFKQKRHALRLATELESIRARGRFNPVLTPKQAEHITVRAGFWEEQSHVD